MRVLIVEDDPVLMNGLVVGLKIGGFSPEAVASLSDARIAIEAGGFLAIVLDIGLPDGSGLDLLHGIRRNGDTCPVLLLTARDQVADRIAGLDTGADDYMGKPFDLAELSARLRALLRRGEGRARSSIEWNGLVAFPDTMSGEHQGKAIKFSVREFALLQYLLERPGTIRSKAELEERLYGWNEEIESNAVEVHIHKLRGKLGARFIETVRGVGYRLALENGS
ncbi:two-component system response regulator QseB [Palleronia aestuarii]|uniref:Two-component system response regulator QseB n=1 Tax=Palleronia aestuarii TaxID=568105 RepID=A0A2W7NI30_9RHOB|nr:winged helix-turn-helix domain-containing protein [Palleronia aestuarii]PZX12806.1 two-component system response regulator QseB [Palleronia aestuarii]